VRSRKLRVNPNSDVSDANPDIPDINPSVVLNLNVDAHDNMNYAQISFRDVRACTMEQTAAVCKYIEQCTQTANG